LLLVVCDCSGATEPDGAGGAGNLGTGGTASNGSGGQASALGGSSPAIGGALGTSGGTGANVRRDCSAHADCTLVSATCCGVCGAPTSSDVVALRVDAATAYQTSVCGPSLVACPACAAMANPDLFASCQDSVCTVVDLLNSPLTACSTNADCALRATRCCECGAPMDVWSLVALPSSHGSGYAALVCDPATACAECMPVYPATPVPNCSKVHCQLNRLE
jgi:hypothetical protein